MGYVSERGISNVIFRRLYAHTHVLIYIQVDVGYAYAKKKHMSRKIIGKAS